MAWIDEFGIERDNGLGSTLEENRASHVTTYGAKHQIVVDLDPDIYGLPRANKADGTYSYAVAKVPAGSAILSALLLVKKQATDTETVTVGLQKQTGAELDNDGLIVAGSVSAVGLVKGAGALIDTVVSEDGYIVVTANAGEAKGLKATLVVEFM